jgi:two-component system sensor histidine kinase BaeS
MKGLGSHPFRLAISAAAVAGLMFAVLFSAAVYEFRRAAIKAGYDLLRPVVNQGADELARNPINPDLAEVVTSNPRVTLAAFSPSGQLIAQNGQIRLRPLTDRGKLTIGGQDAVFVGIRNGRGDVIVGAVPWRDDEWRIRRLALSLVGVWLILVGSIGFTTWTASRITFRPLAEMTHQAETFSGRELGQRLEVKGDDEFAVFAARLNRFLDRLEDSVRRQERFVADAAHELRTPLTVMRGRIETTLLRDRPEAEYRESLRTVLSEAERLSQLVEALLQSALPAESIVPAIDLEVATERVLARWLDRYVAAGVRLETHLEPTTAAIKEAEWNIVVDNLLSNALRATPAGGTCRVTLAAVGTVVAFAVEDDGPGVEPELADRIFDRFTRGESSRNREMGGFGIGLAVTRQMVEIRGGSIALGLSTLTGARFDVRLPTA